MIENKKCKHFQERRRDEGQRRENPTAHYTHNKASNGVAPMVINSIYVHAPGSYIKKQNRCLIQPITKH